MFTSFYFSNKFLLFHTVRSLGRWVAMRYSGALRWCITLVRYDGALRCWWRRARLRAARTFPALASRTKRYQSFI